MDTARYFVAVLLLVTGPPALLFWFLIHPFASFWRRVGPGWTYAVSISAIALVGWGLFQLRAPLLAVDYGTNWGLIAGAVIFLALSVAIALKRRKQLTPRILLGMPEIDAREGGGRLLTEGIYGRIRHPRYVELMLGLTAYALFANFRAIYWLLAGAVVLVYLIVLLEERELRQRFGEAYVEYARRVPRFVPRRGA